MRKMEKSRALMWLFCLFLMYFFIQTPEISQAQEKYPTRTIKLLVPMAAGGATDVILRKLADSVGKSLGQEIIVENKPGAGGGLAASLLAKAKPDGYTIGGVTSSQFVVQPFFTKMDLDPLTDLTPIVQVWSTCAFIAVAMDSPIKTFEDFIEEGRKRQLIVGVTGMVIGDIALERLAVLAKLKLKLVPFGGTSQLIAPLLGKKVDLIEVGALHEYVRAGKVRLLARLNEEATSELKAIPHLKQFGYDINAPGFIGVFGPKGLPRPIQAKLEEGFTPVVNDPSTTEFIISFGNVPTYKNSKDFGNQLKESHERAREMIKELGLGIYAKEKK